MFDARRRRKRYAEGGGVGDDYNTPVDERGYQAWKALNAPNDSGVDYDLRGAYLANMQRAENGHMGDRFKKPNHPTFSDQSQYAVGDQRDRAGYWIGDTFVPPVAMRASGGRVYNGYPGGDDVSDPAVAELKAAGLRSRRLAAATDDDVYDPSRLAPRAERPVFDPAKLAAVKARAKPVFDPTQPFEDVPDNDVYDPRKLRAAPDDDVYDPAKLAPKPVFDAAKLRAFAARSKQPVFDPTQPFEEVPDAGGSWTDTAGKVLRSAAPAARVAANALPGPVGALAAGASNLDPSFISEMASNVPHSALEFGRNMVQPIIHPIDTATDLKNLGLGILEKTGLKSGDDHEKYADAVGKFFADRYGGIENAKRSLATDPVGVAGDLSMLLTGGGGLAARLPGIAGKVGEVAGAAGRAVDPLRAVAGAGTVAGRTAAEIAGVTTGAGSQPIRVAAEAGYEGGQAGRAFREHLTQAAPLEEAVNDARGALAQLRQERGDAYRQAMTQVGADATVLDFNKIDAAVTQANGVQAYRGRSGTGPAQSLSPKTQGIRTEMADAIDNWKNLDPSEFHTAEGIDALKKQIGDIRDATQAHTPERVVADRIYHAVRQTIVDQVPEYARVMKGYEEASKQIKEIETTLSLNPKASIDTTLRKLQSTLRDNVNTSFGRRTELANFLVNAGAPHLMQKLAGQALHSWAPRGLARMAGAVGMETLPALGVGAGAGAPAAAATAAATLPMMSPRLVGEAAYGAGKVGRVLQPVAKPLARTSRSIASPFANEPSPFQ